MSAQDSIADSAPRDCPSRLATVPDFPELEVWTRRLPRDYYRPPGAAPESIRIDYSGWQKDLIAAAIVPESALCIVAGRGNGGAELERRRTDADGSRWYVRSHYRFNASTGASSRFFKVHSYKLIPQVERMPGGPEALAAEENYCAWRAAYDARIEVCRSELERYRAAERATQAIAAPKPRPALRLVVDNTREVTP